VNFRNVVFSQKPVGIFGLKTKSSAFYLQPKVMGEPRTLFHRDELRLGGTTFELHIHPGSDTCEGCEPGQVQARILREEKTGKTFS
jgi:hypothetical protein